MTIWKQWTNRSQAIAFLESGLTDQTNTLGLPSFQSRRFDQSVFSILVRQMKVTRVDFIADILHQLILLRLGLELAHIFYKRSQNVRALLVGCWEMSVLAREFLRLCRLRCLADV